MASGNSVLETISSTVGHVPRVLLRDKALLDRLVDIRSDEADAPGGSDTDAAYADASREAGIDLASLPAVGAGAKIRALPASVVLGLAGRSTIGRAFAGTSGRMQPEPCD